MELTGVCKEEFEKWFREININNNILLNSFYKHPKSMQYGVLEDYFDSVKIHISSHVRLFSISWSEYVSDSFRSNYHDKGRSHTRTQAISKANDLRNEQLKQ